MIINIKITKIPLGALPNQVTLDDPQNSLFTVFMRNICLVEICSNKNCWQWSLQTLLCNIIFSWQHKFHMWKSSKSQHIKSKTTTMAWYHVDKSEKISVQTDGGVNPEIHSASILEEALRYLHVSFIYIQSAFSSNLIFWKRCKTWFL